MRAPLRAKDVARPHEPRLLTVIRCPFCSGLVCKAATRQAMLEIKCRRCGRMWRAYLTDSGPVWYDEVEPTA